MAIWLFWLFTNSTWVNNGAFRLWHDMNNLVGWSFSIDPVCHLKLSMLQCKKHQNEDWMQKIFSTVEIFGWISNLWWIKKQNKCIRDIIHYCKIAQIYQDEINVNDLINTHFCQSSVQISQYLSVCKPLLCPYIYCLCSHITGNFCHCNTYDCWTNSNGSSCSWFLSCLK